MPYVKKRYNIRKAWNGKNAKSKRSRYAKYAYRGLTTAGRALQVASSVANMVNAEKKRFELTVVTTISQFNGATTANYYCADITPYPATGAGVNQRAGSSIKLTSSFFKFKFWSMTSCTSPMKMKYYLLQVLGAPQATATVAVQFLQPDQLNSATVIDYDSPIDPDYYGQYRIIRKGNFYVPAANIASQVVIKDTTLGIKYNRGKGHHIRFNDNTTTISDGQLVLIVVADSGNASGGTATTATGNVPVKAINTGMNMSVDYMYYYYDN